MKTFIAALTVLTLFSCGSGKSTDTGSEVDSVKVDSPTFNADSAYAYVERQVSFGPRVPGTDSHKACADYIQRSLNHFGADTVIMQTGEVTAYTGETLPMKHILGRFYPEADRRVLLLAHYDTRPWADNETDENRHAQPIPGANDGASGVGVLLEIARTLQNNDPGIGVDLLFVDVEDYGDSNGWTLNDETWCLGTQYWVNNMPYGSDTKPMYGILLDMVGGKGARFYREYSSEQMAKGINDKFWSYAMSSDHSDRFVNSVGGSIVDDHLFINRAGIPCIDIIECNNPDTGSFAPTWHTLNDDMENIDRESLGAVGQVVLDVIFNEKNS